ncbi:MAG: AMP-dependent synthetase and ligase [Ilumatobacteraceae bacterium]|nr:AMP-dependent synthetase and ligase [Ilumatobacteraceae bacterium]
MTITFEAAAAQVTAAGSPLEIGDAIINGAAQKVFVNAPPNLGVLFQAAPGDSKFIVYEDETYTFAEVRERFAALGAALVERYGVQKGDRVAVAMRNFPEWIISFAAITSIGAISVSMNSWWTEDEMAFALEDSGATVLIADDARLERSLAACERLGTRMISVRMANPPAGVDAWDDVVVLGTPLPVVAVGPDDDATILYTSGTTGRPKGAVSTHGAVIQALMAFSCRAAIERIRQPAEPSDNPPGFILIVPLFHVTGCVAVMLGCFAAGVKLVIMYKWDVDKALETIEREQITNFVGVPTQSWDLVQSPRFAEFDTSSLRDIGGGGAPAPPALVEKVAGSFKKGNPTIGYGMTETNAYGPGNRGPDYLRKPTSSGRVVPVMEMQIRDADDRPLPAGEHGEIWFKGPNLIRGYWNRPDATAEVLVDGWLRSGDLGRLDDEGFIYVEDRVKDMILRAGENVYCAEVEAAIYELPAVHEAAVFGVPHERLGEEVAAAVMLKPGMSLTAEELRAFVAKQLASFKVPTYIVFRDEALPRNASGKMLKRELQREIAGGA